MFTFVGHFSRGQEFDRLLFWLDSPNSVSKVKSSASTRRICGTPSTGKRSDGFSTCTRNWLTSNGSCWNGTRLKLAAPDPPRVSSLSLLHWWRFSQSRPLPSLSDYDSNWKLLFLSLSISLTPLQILSKRIHLFPLHNLSQKAVAQQIVGKEALFIFKTGKKRKISGNFVCSLSSCDGRGGSLSLSLLSFIFCCCCLWFAGGAVHSVMKSFPCFLTDSQNSKSSRQPRKNFLHFFFLQKNYKYPRCARKMQWGKGVFGVCVCACVASNENTHLTVGRILLIWSLYSLNFFSLLFFPPYFFFCLSWKFFWLFFFYF